MLTMFHNLKQGILRKNEEMYNLFYSLKIEGFCFIGEYLKTTIHGTASIITIK